MKQRFLSLSAMLLVCTQLIVCGLANAEPTAESKDAPQPLESLELRYVRLIPVQSGGRLKPFDEFARETILSITGQRTFKNFDPSEMLVSAMIHPEKWSEVQIIRISNEDVRKQLLLDANRKYFSPQELMASNAFIQYAQDLSSGGNQVTSTGIDVATGNRDPRAEELKRVVDRVSRFQNLVSGRLWAISPKPEGPWGVLADGMTEPTPQSQAVYSMLKSYLEKDASQFESLSFEAKRAIEAAIPNFSEHSAELKAEVIYNRLRPFLQAMILYLIAGLLWMGANAHPLPRVMAKFVTSIAFLTHTLGFGLRCFVAGRPPVTNMYESIVWVSLGVMIFAMVLYSRNRHTVLMSVSSLLAGFALFAGDAAPLVMDPTIRPLVPVLRSNYWLTVHVLTITLSYGAFMLAMGIANVSLFTFYRKSKIRPDAGAQVLVGKENQRIELLNQMAYRALMFGTVLLAAGTILGGIWADYSWGRFWGWDPKEVWALIALLAYMAILHARFTGWVGTFAFPLWTVIAFSTVVMAWYGVNFVLGAGLHSYGFSSGGQAFVAGFLILQCIFCVWVAFATRKIRSKTV